MDAIGPRWELRLSALVGLFALTRITAVTLVTVNSLVGLALADDPALSTLPVTAFVLGGALSTYGTAQLMGRLGRRRGFIVGALAGVTGAALSAWSAHIGSFVGLCLGSAFIGAYAASGQYARFAAVEVVPSGLRHRAQSWVLAGGVIGALVGPQAARLSRDLLPREFVGSYLWLACIAALAMLVAVPLQAGAPAPPVSPAAKGAGVQLLRLEVVVAMAAAVAGYAVMLFLMTATPIAMRHHHHSFDDTARVIEWHVLGMYAPAFVTGSLITRFGVRRIVSVGTLMMLGCPFVNLLGTGVHHFEAALVLLGVGWNFMYMGGTVLLTEACADGQRSRAEGINESLIYGANTVMSLGAGLLLHRVGWQPMNYAAIPPLLVVIGLVYFVGRRRSAAVHRPV